MHNHMQKYKYALSKVQQENVYVTYLGQTLLSFVVKQPGLSFLHSPDHQVSRKQR